MIILKVLIIIVVVFIIAFIINGIEDHNTTSLMRLSFADTMGRLKLPVVSLTNNNKSFNFLIDTGSSVSIIDTLVVDQLKYTKLESEGTAYGIDGNVFTVEYAQIELSHESTKFEDEFQMMRVDAFDNIEKVDGMKIAGILGSTFLKKYNFTIDYENLIVYPGKEK